jgi:hypothetical protein
MRTPHPWPLAEGERQHDQGGRAGGEPDAGDQPGVEHPAARDVPGDQ